MTGQILAATIGTVAFSVLYSVPRAYYPYCGFIGGAGWLVYCLLIPCSSPPEATFFAAILVVLLSRLSAVWERCPVTIFLISGIFPLVPGAGIYYTGYNFFMGNDALALEKGLETIKIAVAIALGTGIVQSLPPFLFHRPAKKR